MPSWQNACKSIHNLSESSLPPSWACPFWCAPGSLSNILWILILGHFHWWLLKILICDPNSCQIRCFQCIQAIQGICRESDWMMHQNSVRWQGRGVHEQGHAWIHHPVWYWVLAHCLSTTPVKWCCRTCQSSPVRVNHCHVSRIWPHNGILGWSTRCPCSYMKSMPYSCCGQCHPLWTVVWTQARCVPLLSLEINCLCTYPEGQVQCI